MEDTPTDLLPSLLSTQEYNLKPEDQRLDYREGFTSLSPTVQAAHLHNQTPLTPAQQQYIGSEEYTYKSPEDRLTAFQDFLKLDPRIQAAKAQGLTAAATITADKTPQGTPIASQDTYPNIPPEKLGRPVTQEDIAQMNATAEKGTRAAIQMMPYMMVPGAVAATGVGPITGALATGAANVGVQAGLHAIDKENPEVGLNIPTAVNALSPIAIEGTGRYLSAPAKEAVETASQQTEANTAQASKLNQAISRAHDSYKIELDAINARIRGVPSEAQKLQQQQALEKFQTTLKELKQQYPNAEVHTGETGLYATAPEATPVLPKTNYKPDWKSLLQGTETGAALLYFAPKVVPFIHNALGEAALVTGAVGTGVVASKVAQRVTSSLLLTEAGRSTLAKIAQGTPISQIEHGLINTAAQSAFKDMSTKEQQP